MVRWFVLCLGEYFVLSFPHLSKGSNIFRWMGLVGGVFCYPTVWLVLERDFWWEAERKTKGQPFGRGAKGRRKIKNVRTKLDRQSLSFWEDKRFWTEATSSN